MPTRHLFGRDDDDYTSMRFNRRAMWLAATPGQRARSRQMPKMARICRRFGRLGDDAGESAEGLPAAVISGYAFHAPPLDGRSAPVDAEERHTGQY